VNYGDLNGMMLLFLRFTFIRRYDNCVAICSRADLFVEFPFWAISNLAGPSNSGYAKKDSLAPSIIQLGRRRLPQNAYEKSLARLNLDG